MLSLRAEAEESEEDGQVAIQGQWSAKLGYKRRTRLCVALYAPVSVSRRVRPLMPGRERCACWLPIASTAPRRGMLNFATRLEPQVVC